MNPIVLNSIQSLRLNCLDDIKKLSTLHVDGRSYSVTFTSSDVNVKRQHTNLASKVYDFFHRKEDTGSWRTTRGQEMTSILREMICFAKGTPKGFLQALTCHNGAFTQESAMHFKKEYNAIKDSFRNKDEAAGAALCLRAFDGVKFNFEEVSKLHELSSFAREHGEFSGCKDPANKLLQSDFSALYQTAKFAYAADILSKEKNISVAECMNNPSYRNELFSLSDEIHNKVIGR